MRLEVRDWGSGFDPDAVSATSIVVYGASVERAELLGGRASIKTEPGWGTLVVAEIPLKGLVTAGRSSLTTRRRPLRPRRSIHFFRATLRRPAAICACFARTCKDRAASVLRAGIRTGLWHFSATVDVRALAYIPLVACSQRQLLGERTAVSVTRGQIPTSNRNQE